MLRTISRRVYSTVRPSIASQLSPSSTLLLKDCSIVTSRVPVEREEIKREYRLLPRDLRSVSLRSVQSSSHSKILTSTCSVIQLDSDLLNPQSTFLVRDSIVLTTPILRAIVSHDRILFVAEVDSEQGEVLAEKVMQLLLGLNDNPFEFRFVAHLIVCGTRD